MIWGYHMVDGAYDPEIIATRQFGLYMTPIADCKRGYVWLSVVPKLPIRLVHSLKDFPM